jgi:HK97 family phage major capsid protein
MRFHNSSNEVSVEAMCSQLGTLAAKSKSIQDRAEAEGRQLTGEEQAEMKQVAAEFDDLETRINAANMQKRVDDMALPMPRATLHDDDPVISSKRPYGSGVHGGMPVGTKKGSIGFRTMGDWAIAARGIKQGKPDQRIMNAPTTFGQEGISSDGGFAVPPDFRENIVKLIQGEDQLLGMVDNLVTSSNSVSMPYDDTTPWQTSGGVLVARRGNDAQPDQAVAQADRGEDGEARVPRAGQR